MKKTILLLCFSILLVSCRENRPVGISLSNGWAVAPGAAAETASDCAGKQFQSIASPVGLERFLPEREGIVWIKNEFFVPAALKSVPLSLFLGRVAFSDEVFLNGHPVGRSGDFSLNRYEGRGSRVYALPETVLDPERGNTLLVKLYAGGGGSLALPASILPAEEARRAALLRGFADEGAAAATAMVRMGRSREPTLSDQRPAAIRPAAPNNWAKVTMAPADPADHPRSVISQTRVKVHTRHCGTTSNTDTAWMRHSVEDPR